MFLSCMTVLSLVLGSSALTEKCHGDRFTFPPIYSPPHFRGKMYFTPNQGGSKRLVMDEGVVKDPRISVSTNNAYMADLTERDAGTFSISYSDGVGFNVIYLDISDCANPASQFYGETYYADVPKHTEYVGYSPRLSNPVVLWNRSDPQTSQGGRRQVRRGLLKIASITQEDNGYYEFRGKEKKLLSRILLTVEGKYRNNEKYAGEELIIRYPSTNSAWTVSVELEGVRKSITLVNAGTLVTESNPDSWEFNERVQLLSDGVKINHLKTRDSGTYEFRDPQNNVGLTVLLEVKPAPPSTLVIVGLVAGVIVAVVICFCCVRKCRSRRSLKRSQAAPRTAAALPVYHPDQNQSSGPSYSVAHAPDQSYRPVNPGVSGEPAASSFDPPTYSTGRNTLLSEFSPLGDQGGTSAPTFGSDCLSSDPAPRFELKKLTFPSAGPLSSDSTVSEVYSSDKLNFLGAL